MTPSASRHVGRIVTAKRAGSVMARRAIVSRTTVLLGRDRRNLAALCGSCPDRVAIGAIHTLSSRMLAMTEDGAENVSARRRAFVRRDLMTDVARPDLRLRCVTRVAVRMGLNTDRDTFTGSCGLVT